jgi:hypothetical protein
MKNSPTLFSALAAIALAVALPTEPVFARGGAAANILNSPGYQRRPQESRQQLSQPAVQPSSIYRRKVRHRHRH